MGTSQLSIGEVDVLDLQQPFVPIGELEHAVEHLQVASSEMEVSVVGIAACDVVGLHEFESAQ